MLRGGVRLGLSVSASFVRRCLTSLTMTPFSHPPHRTGHALLTHPALGQNIMPSPTESFGKHGQADESQMLVEILIGVALVTLAALFMLLAKPPAEPIRSVPVYEPIGRRNRAIAEIVGPSSEFSIQSGHQFFGIEPCRLSICLDMHRFDHALDTLLRRARGYIGPPGLLPVAQAKSISQEVEFVVRY